MMGKALKVIGILWAGLGVLGLIFSTAVMISVSGDSNRAGALSMTVGMSAFVTFFFFILPGAWLAYKGHRLIQGDAHVTLKATNVAMKMDDRHQLDSAAPLLPRIERVERACPFCAEPILVQARVCKHCGRDVPAPNLTIRG